MSELEIDDLLSRHLDGRLSPDEARALEQHMADDPALAEVVAAFKSNGALLRDHIEVELGDIDFDAFTRRVMDALPAEAPAAAPAPAARPAAAPERPRLADRLRRFLVPGLLGAAVAAVATWFVLRPGAVELDDVPGGEVFVDSVSNEGPQTVLISQPVEEGGSTIIWLLEDERDAAEDVDPEGDGGASKHLIHQPDGEGQALPLTEDPI